MIEEKKQKKALRITDRSAKGVDVLLKEIRKAKPLSNEKEYELWQQMKEGDDKARTKLIKHNMLYVVKRAKDFRGSKAALEDLIMAGNEGLVKAADKFDASLGFRFVSFASYYIDNEIRKTAYNHMKHNCAVRLEDPQSQDSDGDEVFADKLGADCSYSADWDMRMRNALEVMKKGVDNRLFNGAGAMLEDLLSMRNRGLSEADFRRKHHLNMSQMELFLNIVREEGDKLLRNAA
jgi:RNA polymerase sigma factor (sigma-70 family)